LSRRALKISTLLLLSIVVVGPVLAGTDDDVIRLDRVPQGDSQGPEAEKPQIGEPRDGFDYDSFETRLESLWFQRKTLLDSGREQDAALQLERIRSFCAAEGVGRLEDLAGALVTDVRRAAGEGNYKRALFSLSYAETFDPTRPQIPLERAVILWEANGGPFALSGELLSALRKSLARSLGDLSLFPQLVFVAGLGFCGLMLGFSLLMVVRYHVSFRHEVEEWVGSYVGGGWPKLAGWALLGLPLISWFGAGWAVVYWVVLTFRFMTRSERLAAVALLAGGVAFLPLYGVGVGLYGTTADPAVRTTLASVGGTYDPDRIVRLKRLVEAHPEDPVYRFLLAGLYKSGRHYDDAFSEYMTALEKDATLVEAHLNVGNIFYVTGQYSEAITNYNLALEQEPESFLAHFNLHLAQSEDFRFHDAEASLQRAHEIDGERMALLLESAEGWGDRPAVQDAGLEMASVWEAALGGRRPWYGGEGEREASPLGQLAQPLSLMCLLALVGCAVMGFVSRGEEKARRCIRCGRPFCRRCKSSREAREYCTQCLHLYVLKDGLAPETKSMKLYEVALHEKRTRRVRTAISFLLPGSVQLLRGKTGRGISLLLLWFVVLATAAPVAASLLGFAIPETVAIVLSGPADVPAGHGASPVGLAALGLLPLLWLASNLWQWRAKEA